MSKLGYWNDWEKCCNWVEKGFAFELKENLKKNYMQYRYFKPAELIYTLMEMVKNGNYKHISIAIIERFVREFGDTPDLPAGIKLVVAPSGDENTLVELSKDIDAIMTCFAKVTESVINAAKIMARDAMRIGRS